MTLEEKLTRLKADPESSSKKTLLNFSEDETMSTLYDSSSICLITSILRTGLGRYFICCRYQLSIGVSDF